MSLEFTAVSLFKQHHAIYYTHKHARFCCCFQKYCNWTLSFFTQRQRTVKMDSRTSSSITVNTRLQYLQSPAEAAVCPSSPDFFVAPQPDRLLLLLLLTLCLTAVELFQRLELCRTLRSRYRRNFSSSALFRLCRRRGKERARAGECHKENVT